VVELRQYRLRPGKREVLIELFEREFIESQEAVGIEVIGQFRDLDRADRFVWLRGFPDMERRRDALAAFYGGPVWKLNGQAANATMIDSDDVLLLRPLPTASGTSGFGAQPPRPALGAQVPASRVLATICSLDGPVETDLVGRTLLPALASTEAPPLAAFMDEPSPNTFAALPVRAGEHVAVWIQSIPDNASAKTETQARRASRQLARDLLPGLSGPPAQLRLQPTPRSRFR
jgi:NIPSNAP